MRYTGTGKTAEKSTKHQKHFGFVLLIIFNLTVVALTIQSSLYIHTYIRSTLYSLSTSRLTLQIQKVLYQQASLAKKRMPL